MFYSWILSFKMLSFCNRIFVWNILPLILLFAREKMWWSFNDNALWYSFVDCFVEADLGNSIFTVVPEDIHFLEEIGSGKWRKSIMNEKQPNGTFGCFSFMIDFLTSIFSLFIGTFGSVYKAIWKGDLVAAKKLKCKIEDVELIQSFQKETLLLSKMRHPNVVMLMAASCRAPELIIVTELMKSDLAALISSKEKIEWKEKIQMATDIARGMTYLHHMNPPMIHR